MLIPGGFYVEFRTDLTESLARRLRALPVISAQQWGHHITPSEPSKSRRRETQEAVDFYQYESVHYLGRLETSADWQPEKSINLGLNYQADDHFSHGFLVEDRAESVVHQAFLEPSFGGKAVDFPFQNGFAPYPELFNGFSPQTGLDADQFTDVNFHSENELGFSDLHSFNFQFDDDDWRIISPQAHNKTESLESRDTREVLQLSSFSVESSPLSTTPDLPSMPLTPFNTGEQPVLSHLPPDLVPEVPFSCLQERTNTIFEPQQPLLPSHNTLPRLSGLHCTHCPLNFTSRLSLR
jgi:hypothetical protein